MGSPRRLALVCFCLIPNVTSAAVFTAGVGGGNATVQGALTAAGAAAGENEVRIRSGTYVENLTLASMTGTVLQVSGGWNGTFTMRNLDPNETVIDGNLAGRVFAVTIVKGDLTVEGLTLKRGMSTGSGAGGAGLYFNPNNSSAESSITVVNCRIVENRLEKSGAGSGVASGAGMLLSVYGTGVLTVEDSVISGNKAIVSGTLNASLGGGARFLADGSASLSVKRNVFENNVSNAVDNGIGGVGFYLELFGNATGVVSDNLIRGNHATGVGSISNNGVGSDMRVAMSGKIVPTGTLVGSRNRWLDDVDETVTEASNELSLVSEGSGSIRLTDSVIAGGSKRGVQTLVTGASTIQLVNVTIADHPQEDLRVAHADTGSVQVYNSIVFDPGQTELPSPATGSNNLLGVDPLFEDSANNDYRPRNTSPALNIGLNSPPGGLGATDLAGGTRILQSVVDAGAYEIIAAPTATPTMTPTVTPTATPRPLSTTPQGNGAGLGFVLLAALALWRKTSRPQPTFTRR